MTTASELLPASILLIDDDHVIEQSLGGFLRERGYSVTYADTPQKGLACFSTRDFDIVVTDIRMPGMTGLDLLNRIKAAAPETEVIVITGYATIDDAVAALRSGAADFLQKPIDLRQMLLAIEKALQLHALRRENILYHDRLERVQAEHTLHEGDDALLGVSPAMRAAQALIARVARSPGTTVLITGESGTGKELAARMIHAGGTRGPYPLISVNCSAFAATLIESELFGHEKGSFTGADRQKKGVIELADRGTLFLDEIGDLPLELQGRLLRVLEDRRIRRLGGQKDFPVDFRLISATNRDLAQLVEAGRFRQDLFYRLSVMVVPLPPLRDRREDIPLLARHFLAVAARQVKKPVHAISDAAMKRLVAHDFPGNVRELRNLVEQAVILTDANELGPDDFVALKPKSGPASPTPGTKADAPQNLDLRQAEISKIKTAITQAQGNLRKAAELLGIGYGALRYRLKKLGIPA